MKYHMLYRTFFELLPYRIAQAITPSIVRRWHVRRAREWTAPSAVPGAKVSRRLFVDMTVISKYNAGTGIQRVVHALAVALLEEAPPRWEIHFVSATRHRPYHIINWPNTGEKCDIAEVEIRPGDVFLGLDYSLDAVRRHRKQLARFRKSGGRLWFLVHDLLPVQKPKWFSRNTVIRYNAWMDILAGISDGFLCNSSQTDIDLKKYLYKRYGLRQSNYTKILHLGHKIIDFNSKNKCFKKSTDEVEIPEEPFLLMVGTLEPRKGHGDILAAFDELWRKGEYARLVLVGKKGWKVDQLCEKILEHSQYRKRLYWYDDLDDEGLDVLYRACSGVIIASYAEGFGLPLVEALGYGKPVFARDIPIFREHADKGVRFFPAAASSGVLAKAIRDWQIEAIADRIMVERPTKGWRDSAIELIDAIT